MYCTCKVDKEQSDQSLAQQSLCLGKDQLRGATFFEDKERFCESVLALSNNYESKFNQ